jgi:DNA repair protein RecO
MTYAIHKVEGLIVNILPYGESGEVIKIWSQELGLFAVLAHGVREMKGKLKYNLQILNFVEVEFVEGKEVKRLTGVKEIKNYKNILFNTKKRKIFSNLVSLLDRFLIDEVENIDLYKSFIKSLDFLNDESFKEEYFEGLEILSVINILFWAGYWHEEKDLEVSQENFEKVKSNKEILVQAINKSIKATHL